MYKIRHIFAVILILKQKKMKKLFLTSVVLLSGLFASAQFIVTTELAKDDEDKYSVSSLTTNLGFGYEVMDKLTIGLSMKDATVDYAGTDSTWTLDTTGGNTIPTYDDGSYTEAVDDGTIVSDMQVFVRYAVSDNLFISVTTPMGSDDPNTSAQDLMRVGAGYSFDTGFNGIHVEASYSMLLKGGDDGADKKSKMNIGLSMKF